MFKKEFWGIPAGMWMVGMLYALVGVLLRSYYVDYESVRQIATVAEGVRRESLSFWSGHGPLGMLLFWLLTKPLAFVFPLLEGAQILGAIAVTLTGWILFRILRTVGLTSGLSGWLTVLFYFSNVALNASTMLSFPAIALLLMAWWTKSALHMLAPREVDSASLLKLGVWGGLLCAVNLFALMPTVAGGILALRRGQGGTYWGGLMSVLLGVYLAVYFVVLPNPVVVQGVERPKPSLIEWVATGSVNSPVEPPRLSGIYWQSVGEQLQNALIALGRPFRVRDVYQYYAGGTFITLLKGAFLALMLLTVILILTIRFSGERVISDRLVSVTRQLGGYTLLISMPVLVFWQGDYQPLYLWTLFGLMVGIGGWLASYVEEDIQRVNYGIVPLALIMVLFGLMKQGELRPPEHDGERQEAEAVREILQEEGIFIASTRLAEWLRYYAGGKSRVIASEYWQEPDKEFLQLIESAKQTQQRVIVWQYALDPELYRTAHLPVDPQWLDALERARAEFQKGEGGYLRRYARIVFYPTMVDIWYGEVRTYGEQKR